MARSGRASIVAATGQVSATDPDSTYATTAKMKFQLALKVSIDPVTAAGIFGVAAILQAADSPKYGQGWGAYGECLGATAADGFTDIMIGGAVLPSLLHQDPRYFYQGTGTTGSRIRHAIFSPFVTRSDSGTPMPNYSSLGGDLAAASLSIFSQSQSRGRSRFGQLRDRHCRTDRIEPCSAVHHWQTYQGRRSHAVTLTQRAPSPAL